MTCTHRSEKHAEKFRCRLQHPAPTCPGVSAKRQTAPETTCNKKLLVSRALLLGTRALLVPSDPSTCWEGTSMCGLWGYTRPKVLSEWTRDIPHVQDRAGAILGPRSIELLKTAELVDLMEWEKQLFLVLHLGLGHCRPGGSHIWAQ